MRLAANFIRDGEGDLHSLAVIESRIAIGVVSSTQILFAQTGGPAEALGDIFPGQLKVNAAESRAQASVYCKCALQFG